MFKSVINITRKTFENSSYTNFKNDYKFIDTCPNPIYDTGCTYCEIPKLPTDKQLNTKPNKLKNSKAYLYKHVFVFSGDSNYIDWPSRFEMAPTYTKNDIIMEIQKYKKKVLSSYHPIMVSMTSLQDTNTNTNGTGDVSLLGVYPDGIAVEVPHDKIEEFMKAFLTPETKDSTSLRNQFRTHPLQKDLILTCGHLKRDIRCGVLAPLINKEFEKILESKQLLSIDNSSNSMIVNDNGDDNNSNNVNLGYVSHVGGHVYAGNVLICKKNGDVIWYGHCLPKHVQGIVDETVLNNKIIKELYRGE
ncbi:hypothetical protein CANARDRAFT_177851 [[Candida] arabinofermentans NRRL YB-2248]|uniref:Altered inheritance of mitochondria protein 32 n=1 Tax=[Candida] arabinofermentans NRRL YB-2248 TaxID=983967 RepID=A0A1E4SUV8_9ASCO|nr:hypothetical protein CANARDRAFT_177851 [[Candida] arabinofermentans NRRL YB-2248]